MNLRVSKNTRGGAKWHIIKEDGEAICGTFNIKNGECERSFKGIDRKPALGTWCGICKRVFNNHYEEETGEL